LSLHDALPISMVAASRIPLQELAQKLACALDVVLRMVRRGVSERGTVEGVGIRVQRRIRDELANHLVVASGIERPLEGAAAAGRHAESCGEQCGAADARTAPA